MNCHLLVFSLASLSLVSFTCKKNKQSVTHEIKKIYAWDKFSMGVDLSYVNQVEDYGGVYKDSGKIKDQIGRAHV